MINVHDDPLVALVAVNGYAEGENKIKGATDRLKTYLLAKGISE